MVNLSQAWAEGYMRTRPGVRVSVTGGGTGTGIAALINGTCDVANASREMKKGEWQALKNRGVKAVQIAVAKDGLAIAVHSSNPIKSLTLPQIADIYTGKITNWAQLGGKPGRIVVLSRESSSGTYAFMREHVMGNQPYTPNALLMPATRMIQEEISKNPNAIGYGGEAYFKGKPNVRMLPVAFASGQKPVFPTEANVVSGKYPISRPLLVYCKANAAAVVFDFIRYCKSAAGQALVRKIGYVPLK
jgi:phosphate transport system substrate-binding protein